MARHDTGLQNGERQNLLKRSKKSGKSQESGLPRCSAKIGGYVRQKGFFITFLG